MEASSSSSPPPSKNISGPPEVVEDCFGILKLYNDGSISRVDPVQRVETVDDGSAIWKDCVFDKEHELPQRIYVPRVHHSSHQKIKLPVVYYLHAGGFCFSSLNRHNTCLSLCSGLQAIVISPFFRLAPEHRLPAALEDARRSLKYLQNQATHLMPEETETASELICGNWLHRDGVDFDRVFIFGDSSGGNIAHHLAVLLGAGSHELRPIRVRGYILLSPFFGGDKRSKREEERPYEDKIWTQDIFDQYWRLALPIGANRDHPLANPFGPESPSLEGVSLDPILVLVGGDELLRDRTEEYAKMMKQLNHKLTLIEFQGKLHGFFTTCSYTQESQTVIKLVNTFMSEL